MSEELPTETEWMDLQPYPGPYSLSYERALELRAAIDHVAESYKRAWEPIVHAARTLDKILPSMKPPAHGPRPKNLYDRKGRPRF